MKSKINVEFLHYDLYHNDTIEVDTSQLSFDIEKVVISSGTLYQKRIELESFEKENGFPLTLFVTVTNYSDDQSEESEEWEVHMRELRNIDKNEYQSYTMTTFFVKVMQEILTESIKLLPRNNVNPVNEFEV